MSKEISLSKLTLIYTAGNLASKVITFALFFVYTFFLSKEDIGVFDIIISTISLLTPLLNLQIYDAILRWLIHEPKPQTVGRVITNSVFLVAVSSVLSVIILSIAVFFFDIQYSKLICLLIVVNIGYPVFQYAARGLGQNTSYVISGVLYSVCSTISTIVALYFFHLKIEGLLISNILAVFVSISYLIGKVDLPRYVKPKSFDRQLLREMISFSLPLLPNTLGWWAISMANRYIIVLYLGVGANGVFALAMKFPSILMMLANIFYMAWQEKAIKYYTAVNRDEYYTEVFEKYCVLLFSGLTILIAFTKPALRFLVAPSYYETWKFLPILYLAIGYQSLASFYGTGYLSSKDTIGALTTTVLGAVLTIVGCFVLIPYLGLIGASLAVFTGYFFLFLSRVYDTRKYFKITFPLKKFVVLNIFVICISIATITENTILLYLNAFISIIVTYVFNREIIRQYALKYGFKLTF